MAVTLSAAAASALADQITALVDAGSAAGTLEVYTGAKPASPDDTATGTLLATFTLTDPAAAAAVAGVASWDLDPALSATVLSDGTAGWFRVSDSDGVAIFDGIVGTTGTDLNVATAEWTTGGTVTLDSGGVTMPQGV